MPRIERYIRCLILGASEGGMISLRDFGYRTGCQPRRKDGLFWVVVGAAETSPTKSRQAKFDRTGSIHSSHHIHGW